jgi:hypothetical protein
LEEKKLKKGGKAEVRKKSEYEGRIAEEVEAGE